MPQPSNVKSLLLFFCSSLQTLSWPYNSRSPQPNCWVEDPWVCTLVPECPGGYLGTLALGTATSGRRNVGVGHKSLDAVTFRSQQQQCPEQREGRNEMLRTPAKPSTIPTSMQALAPGHLRIRRKSVPAEAELELDHRLSAVGSANCATLRSGSR